MDINEELTYFSTHESLWYQLASLTTSMDMSLIFSRIHEWWALAPIPQSTYNYLYNLYDALVQVNYALNTLVQKDTLISTKLGKLSLSDATHHINYLVAPWLSHRITSAEKSTTVGCLNPTRLLKTWFSY